MQARAAVQYYRSQYFPTVQVGPSATRDRQSQNRPLYVPGSKTTYNDLFLQGEVTWEPDCGATSAERWNRNEPLPRRQPQIWRTSI